MTNDSQFANNLTGLVIFEVAGVEFCTDLKDLSAIINPNELRNFSEVSNDYKIEFNESLVPIIDLHNYCDLEKKSRTDDIRLLLIEIDEVKFGFFVEKVKEILTMSREFRDNLKFHQRPDAEYMKGILTYEGRRIYLLDFQKIGAELANK